MDAFEIQVEKLVALGYPKLVRLDVEAFTAADEGIALLTHYPEFLQRNHCFSLLGSRGGDKRVPALWLSAGHPKLGWCWAGNPHTWLGSASCRARSPGVPLSDISLNGAP